MGRPPSPDLGGVHRAGGRRNQHGSCEYYVVREDLPRPTLTCPPSLIVPVPEPKASMGRPMTKDEKVASLIVPVPEPKARPGPVRSVDGGYKDTAAERSFARKHCLMELMFIVGDSFTNDPGQYQICPVGAGRPAAIAPVSVIRGLRLGVWRTGQFRSRRPARLTERP
jgi:hypothetical protein